MRSRTPGLRRVRRRGAGIKRSTAGLACAVLVAGAAWAVTEVGATPARAATVDSTNSISISRTLSYSGPDGTNNPACSVVLSGSEAFDITETTSLGIVTEEPITGSVSFTETDTCNYGGGNIFTYTYTGNWAGSGTIAIQVQKDNDGTEEVWVEPGSLTDGIPGQETRADNGGTSSVVATKPMAPQLHLRLVPASGGSLTFSGLVSAADPTNPSTDNYYSASPSDESWAPIPGGGQLDPIDAAQVDLQLTPNLDAKANVKVIMSAPVTQAAINQKVTYTIAVKNPGPSTAANVVVNATMSPDVTPVAPAHLGNSKCTPGSDFTCNLGSLAKGAVDKINIGTFVSTVDPAVVTNGVSNVTVTSSTKDSHLQNNVSSSTVVLQPDPAVSSGGGVSGPMDTPMATSATSPYFERATLYCGGEGSGQYGDGFAKLVWIIQWQEPAGQTGTNHFTLNSTLNEQNDLGGWSWYLGSEHPDTTYFGATGQLWTWQSAYTFNFKDDGAPGNTFQWKANFQWMHDRNSPLWDKQVHDWKPSVQCTTSD